MQSRTQLIVSVVNVLCTTVAVIVLSLFVVFRAAESRWCFHLDHVNRECVDAIKAEKGLNGGAEGGFSSNQTQHDRVVMSGCFQTLLREYHDGCIDASFLGDFYSCVYNYTTDMNELEDRFKVLRETIGVQPRILERELEALNLTSLESAKELGKAFKECLNGKMVPWTEEFWPNDDNNTAIVGGPFF